VSSVTAVDGAYAARGPNAAYTLKDLIRAQIERHWHPDRKRVEASGWRVSVHIMLDATGRVLRADIVDDPRQDATAAYRDFALSARNAVLMSSPLVVPPAMMDLASDMTVVFDLSWASR
jgi:hypothetical protein